MQKKAPLRRVTHSKTVVESDKKRERYWLECKHYVDLRLSARRPQRMRCYECKNGFEVAA